jgi:ketosteroid isomerase-like protein
LSHRIREQFQAVRRGELVRLCAVRNCGATTTQLNGLCNKHKSARRRNGHELQRAIGLKTIRRYANKVYPFLVAGDMETMVAALETVKRHAGDYVATHTDPQHRSRNAQGQPYTRRERVEFAARRELVESLGNIRDVRLAVILITGMVVIQELVPSLIASDDAFRFQVARAVRRAGKPVKGSSPVPTRAGVMVEAGQRMHEALGRVTFRLAHEVARQDEREFAVKMAERDAMEAEREAAAAKRNPDDDFYIDMNGKVQRRGA